VIEIDEETERFILTHRVARLATADGNGKPQVVPICYAFDGSAFFSAIDDKPKSVEPDMLRRVRNIRQNPRASLLIDDYSDDWSRLAWVLVDGRAEIIEPETADHHLAVVLLRSKYSQYVSMPIEARPIIKVVPERIKRWQYTS
jgi:PPOX class probable F420-dependent enzyme